MSGTWHAAESKDIGPLVTLWGSRNRKTHEVWSQFLKLSRPRAGCQHGSQGRGVASEGWVQNQLSNRGYLLTSLDDIEKEKNNPP